MHVLIVIKLCRAYCVAICQCRKFRSIFFPVELFTTANSYMAISTLVPASIHEHDHVFICFSLHVSACLIISKIHMDLWFLFLLFNFFYGLSGLDFPKKMAGISHCNLWYSCKHETLKRNACGFIHCDVCTVSWGVDQVGRLVPDKVY